MPYSDFKDRFVSQHYTALKFIFIDSHAWENYGNIVTTGYQHIFDEVEQVNISPGGINHVGTGQYSVNIPKGYTVYNPTNSLKVNTLNEKIQNAYKAAAIYGNSEIKVDWTGSSFKEPTEFKKPKCECGAHKIGVNDYQGGHSHYCPVHHDKRK